MGLTTGWRRLAVAATAVFYSAAGGAQQAYYLFDGDQSRGVEIQNGAVVTGFDTFDRGYPVAITDTIWLGNRDNGGAVEYTLAGTPTGATSAGGEIISQILDGTTDGVNNYGVTCCRGPNVVTVANADWTNQRVLFTIGENGGGIAFDTLSNTFYVSTFGSLVINYSLAGDILGQFGTGDASVVGLAYDQSTDSLWGWDTNSSSLQQYSTAGVLLGSTGIDVAQYGIENPFGGEMAISLATGVPEPATWAMMLLGFGAIGVAMRRRPAKAVVASLA